MQRILVIVDLERGRPDDSTWELCAAARSLLEPGGRAAAAVLGEGLTEVAAELARGWDEVFVVDDARVAVPEREGFDLVLAPHTNRGIDLAPTLAARLDRPLLADVLSLELRADGLAAVRTVHGGKVRARVVAAPSERGWIATVRGGAFAKAEPADAGGTVTPVPLPEGFAPRRRPLRTVEAEAGAVDLSQAEVLVAVGRGIEEEENLSIARALAEALGGELCCSRPVVDKGWLPKSRQVGTSGVTVHPRLYVALGISGSFQHVGGIKGSPYLVAVNKDPAAPIFEAADVGIVGDLLDVVPALEEELRKVMG